MTFISCLISLKNVASGWVLKNTLDMLCPLKYLLMSLIRFPYVLTLSLLRNPINTAVAFTVFVGSRIPLSNIVQVVINKVYQYLIIIINQNFFQERIRAIKKNTDKNLYKDEISGKTGETNSPKIPIINASDIIGCTFLMPSQEDTQIF